MWGCSLFFAGSDPVTISTMSVWATRIAHGERLRGPVSRGIAKCHNLAHPGLDLVRRTRQRVNDRVAPRTTRARLGPALRGPDLTFCDIRQIREFLVLRYISPLTIKPYHAPQSGHGWFDGAQRAPSNHPTPVTGSERAQPQEVPNRANSARLAAPLA